MTEQQLGEVINGLYDMERNNYHTMRMIQELDARCSRLGIRRQFAPIDHTFDLIIPDGNDWRDTLTPIGVAGGVLITIICAVLEVGSFWTRALVFILAPCILGFVLRLIGCILDSQAYSKKYDEEMQKWDVHCAQLEASRSTAIAQDNGRVQRELVVKNGLLSELSELRTRLQEGKQVIQTMYDDAGIDSAYRKLIPIRYMFDYYKLGISRKLEGTDGLYYLVRQELRADQFNASLQDISSKMSTLIKGQSEVYRELCEANNRSAKMIGELINHVDNMSSNMISEAVNIRGEIAKGTQVAAYTAKRMEAEISYLSYFSSLRSQGIGISAK